MIHHGTLHKKTLSYFTTLQIEVLICVYGKSEHIFRKRAIRLEQRSLALPSYKLPLNFHLASVLRPGLRCIGQMSPVNFLPVQSSEQREWLRMMTLMSDRKSVV